MNTPEHAPSPGRELRRHQWKVASAELRHLGKRNLSFEATTTSAAALCGGAYAAVLALNQAPQHELIFTALLLVATVALFWGLALTRRYFFLRGRVFFAIADRSARWGSGPLEHLRLAQRIFNVPARMTAGVLYGAIVGSAPFVLPGNYTNQLEQIALSLFLFFANFLTGSAQYALVLFFMHGGSLFRRLVVNMWSPGERKYVDPAGACAPPISVHDDLCVSQHDEHLIFELRAWPYHFCLRCVQRVHDFRCHRASLHGGLAPLD